jgi:hypothetical protein
VGETLAQRLGAACEARGLAWVTRPDEPFASPPYSAWWGCAYDPVSGEIAALVTGGSGKSLLRALLDRLLAARPPLVRRVRDGVVTEHRKDAGRLVLTLEDGSLLVVPYPLVVPVQVGAPVRLVELQGDDDQLFLWGEDRVPTRSTQWPTPIEEPAGPDPAQR